MSTLFRSIFARFLRFINIPSLLLFDEYRHEMFAARNVRDASNAHPIALERITLTRVAFLHQFWLHRVRKCKGNRTTGREVRRSVQKGWIFYLVFIVIIRGW